MVRMGSEVSCVRVFECNGGGGGAVSSSGAQLEQDFGGYTI